MPILSEKESSPGRESRIAPPIAVFKGSLDLLQRQSERPQEDLSARAHAPNGRRHGGINSDLLLLARGEELQQPGVRVRLNDLILI